MVEKLITVNIINDVVRATYTGGRYKGEEVNNFLDKKVDELTSSSLLKIDFEKANPLDYVFCQYAFGPVIKKIQGSNKSVLFNMQQVHKRCFFRGILKYVDKSLPRNTSPEESERIFQDAGLFTMLMIDKKEVVEYKGNLTLIENSILTLINNSLVVSERDIINSIKDAAPTDIIHSLESLIQKGFILNSKNEANNYLSIYKLLNGKL